MDSSSWKDATRRRARALVDRARAGAARAAGRAREAFRETLRALRRLPRRSARTLLGIALVLAVLVLAIVLVDVFIDEPLRASIERRMNAALQGYTVRIGAADLNPWNFSLALSDLAVRQQAHPDPPVLDLEAFEFSVEWRALLRLRLVADARIVRPRLFVHLAQLREERDDDVDLDERGWQDALEEAYPLKINALRIAGGRVTYVDEDPERPLELSQIRVLARNLRNVEDPETRHPSSFRASAAVFDSGRAALAGRADFLAEPSPAFLADARVEAVPLDRLGPLIEDYRLNVSRGVLSARGELEHGPERRRATLEEVLIAGIQIDYVSDPELTQRAVEAVTEAKREPSTEIVVRRLRLTGSELGFISRARDPSYRLFLSGTELVVDGWSNQPDSEGSRFRARGAFMGSGRTAIQGAFRPDPGGADFDLAIAIEGTELAAMNDLLRAYANLDVTEGLFSFYSELRVAGGRVDGYVKPLFHEVEVYDAEQDREKGFFRQLWERIAEGLAEILENPPREDVATVADISGPVSSPDASNLQVVLNLIENAFFDSILPGFREQAKGGD
jgi:hypothetical protein